MKLNRLLEIHDLHQPSSSLGNNLGDGFLIEKNRIFKNIRNASLKNFKFSSQPNDFYSALPLSQLENILSKQVIPYADNVSVLKDLEAKWPKLTEWGDIYDNLKRNFVFHESCHVVARSEANQERNASEQALVLQMLLEESFANTCEFIGAIDAEDAIHKIFYEINSYSSLFEERSFLKNAVSDLGETVLMKFILLNYLHANFLVEDLNEKIFEINLKLSLGQSQKVFTGAQLKNFKALAKICYTLDERFRYITTKFYLRINGVKSTQADLLNFDFMKLIESNPYYMDYINRLVKIAIG